MRLCAVSLKDLLRGRRNLHHVRIALGSLAELETQLEIAQRLGLMSSSDLTDLTEQLKRTGQLLHGLARSLRLQQLKGAAAGSAGLILLCCLLLI